jgi:hypothetical protein
VEAGVPVRADEPPVIDDQRARFPAVGSLSQCARNGSAASPSERHLQPWGYAPWVRMTILADPQGATFTASRFTPENKDLGG